MPTEHNKDARGPSGLTESELLAWYESLISAGKARGIALDETHPMVPGQFVVCDTNGETLTDAIKARALGEENTPDKDSYRQMAEALYVMASSGRLFVYGEGERFPRRVLTEAGKAVITEPMDRLTMPKPLSGWYWFANKITGGWAYRQEQQAYEAAMRDYRQHPAQYWPDEKLPASFDRGEAAKPQKQAARPSVPQKQAARPPVQSESRKKEQAKKAPEPAAKPAPYDLNAFLASNPSREAMEAFAQAHNDRMSPDEMLFLSDMIQAAKPHSDPGVSRASSTSAEFTGNQALIDQVGTCNDPQRLQDVLDGKGSVALSSHDKDFLRHRIQHLNALRELEQNLPEKQVQGDLVQSGKELWLTNVTQPKKQRTGNGCWSVSLQTQLAFRGVQLDQETIRAVRPGNQNNYNYDVTEREYNNDTTQTMTDYANLVHRVLPNTAVHAVTLSKNDVPKEEDRAALLRDMVELAMKKHRSPVSIVYGTHYRTIFGMDENNVYVKNPLNADPDHCQAIPIRDITAQSTFQLTWLQDLTPGLDGSTPLLGHYSASSGNTYYGGKLVFNEAELSGGAETLCCQTNYRSLSGKNIRIESFMPDQLKYRRHSGAQPDSYCVNLDALSAYETQIAPLAQKNDAYKPLHDALKDMLENQTQTTHENLYALTKAYQNAYRVSVQELNNDPGNKDREAAHELLMTQTSEMRSCLRSYLNFQNQKLIGDPGKSYLDTPQWADMEKGMASALHDQLVCSRTPLEDPSWLEHLSPNKRGQAIDTFRQQPDVQRMMQDFKKTCEVEFAKGFRGERKTVEIKAAIRGGNMLPLVREHRNACKQIEEQNRGKANGKDMSAAKTASSLSKGK